MAAKRITSRDVPAFLKNNSAGIPIFINEPTRYYVLRQFKIIATYVNSTKPTEEVVGYLRKKFDRPAVKNKKGELFLEYFKIISVSGNNVAVVCGKKCITKELGIIKELKKKINNN